MTLINAAVSHELRNPLNSLINQAMFLKNYLQDFTKFMSSQNEVEQDDNTKKVLKKIETMFRGIDVCAQKMQHATQFINFFVGDILDYSVLNEASENF